jgi:hypothetical protein
MKKILFVMLTFFFISASAFAQRNERKVIPAEGGKYVSCGHDEHGQECGSWTFVPDEPIIDPNVQASPVGGCTPRPYRQLVAYDDQLLVNYTHQQIVDLVMKAQKRFANALDSSGIENQAGTVVVGIIPVKIPSYTSMFTVKNWLDAPNDGTLDSLLIIKNELLDADNLMVITREGITVSEKGVNLQFNNNPQVPLDLVYKNLWKANTGVVNFITLVANNSYTFAHETGHGIGGAHEVSGGVPPYALAYVNTIKGVNCVMKGSTGGNTYPRFSGPNSKIIKNGETITLCEDTAKQNGAKHISECLDLIWCATANHVTRVSLPSTNCGSGTLHAITNNADTFLWKVVSGSCSISGSGKEISYMAMTTSKVQVVAQKKGKWYWDTATVIIPAVQTFPTQMEKCVGTKQTLPDGSSYVVSKDTTIQYLLKGTPCDSVVILNIKALPTSASSQKVEIKSGQSHTLPDGKKVSTTGTYISKLTNQWGCDSTITTNLTVTTATVNPKVFGINIYPNPTDDILTIEGIRVSDKLHLQDLMGRNLPFSLESNKLSLGHLSNGIYMLTLQRGDAKVVMKVLKI